MLPPPAPPCCALLSQRLRPVADKIAAMSPEERANFRMEDGTLGPVHWRCIEKLYADQVRRRRGGGGGGAAP